MIVLPNFRGIVSSSNIKSFFDPYADNVSLLLHMDGDSGSQTFTDSSTNNFNITAFGNAQISTAQKKYGDGSALFDGNGDYLRGFQQFNSSDNFTIEGWVYRTGSPSLGTIFEAGNISPGIFGIHLYIDSSGTFFLNNGLSGAISGGSAPLNQWVHFAIVRDNNINKLYINGVLVGTTNQTIPTSNNIYSIGGAPNYGFYFQGYIDDFRITYGVARYTSNFTPPQQLPEPSDPHAENVSLLLHMDGLSGSQTFINSSLSATTLSAFGNAQISTSVKKFGSGAGQFLKPGQNYIKTSSDPAFGLGTGDFTIEMWLYKDTPFENWNGFFCINEYNTNGILIRVQTVADSLYVGGITHNWSPAVNFPLSQWNHFALVRNNGIITVYVNGNSVFTANNTTNLGSIGYVTIGTSSHSLTEMFNGYIDEVRVTKGVARYTSNFVPPTAPFPNL